MTWAFDKERDDQIFQRWIPYQTECGFDEFKAKLTPPRFKSTQEIMDDTEKIMDSIAGGNHGHI